jgi:hypothetical protein
VLHTLIHVSLYQAVEAHRVMKCRGVHIFYTIDSQMVVMSPAVYSRERLSGTDFCVPRDRVQLEGLGK